MFLLLIFIFFWSVDISADYKIVCTPASFCSEVGPIISRILKHKDTKSEIEKKVSQIEIGTMIDVITVQDGEPIIVHVNRKKIVAESKVTFKNSFEDEDDVRRILPQKGSYFIESTLNSNIEKAKKYLIEHGFTFVKITKEIQELEDKKVVLTFNIDNDNAEVVDKVKIQGDLLSLIRDKSFLLKKYEGKRLRKTLIDQSVSEIKNALEENGYLFNQIEVKYIPKLNSFIKDVYINIVLGPRIQFSLSGKTFLLPGQVKKILTDEIENNPSEDYTASFKVRLEEELLKRGIYESKIKVSELLATGLEGQSLKTYIVEVIDGHKVEISNINFQGNIHFKDDELLDLYYEKSSVIAGRDYYDAKFVNDFQQVLKELYLKNGFVFSQISKPRVYFSDDKKSVEIIYSLFEGKQSFLKGINIDALDEEQKVKVIKGLENKEGQALNVVAIEKDLNIILSNVRELGYYFAKIENANKKTLITYSKDYEESFLNLKLSLGKKSYYDDSIIIGNKSTKDIVIKREIRLQKGDIILPSTLVKLRNRLNSLGLFSSIVITPIVLEEDNGINKIILFIQVSERAFGRGEVAPGFRSDLGGKLSLLIAKKNLWGLNHSISFQSEINMRYTLVNLDARRQAEGKDLLEGLLRTSYNLPYLFNFSDFRITASYQRKRFTAFDADIYRVAPTLYKKVNDILSLNLEYQLEQIRQFDATSTKDQATFRIGSLTPGFSLDFRDNPAVPRSGAFFTFSWEFANPTLFSKKDSDIEIDFYKVISRNRFYIPLWKKNFVLATSLSAGVQENQADSLVYNSDGSVATNDDGSNRTRGYIPSIKVFRLDGIDLVRGFSETEINRLNSGNDISSVRVQGKAFFSNLKVEPRYYVSDSMVVGLFYDAGRVYLNSFQPSDLRSSVGATFKFLTPVGTLDFDYGIKTDRKTINGAREGFGRFHLNIGYF